MLIEILITLLVTMVGFVGLAAMGLLSSRWTHNAYLRSQAIIHAHEMADRMLSSPGRGAVGDYSNASGISGNSPVCKTSESSTTIECGTSHTATFDLAEWKTMFSQQLPSGAGGTSNSSDGVFNHYGDLTGDRVINTKVLTKREQKSNHIRSRNRVGVEHVFEVERMAQGNA